MKGQPQSNQKLDNSGSHATYQNLDNDEPSVNETSSPLNNPLLDEIESGRNGRKSIGIALDDEDRFNQLMSS